MKRSQSAFTLIELMIVVAIVAILLTIGLPAYQDSVRKSRRADGKTALIGLELAQEKFRASCRFYASTLDSTQASLCDDTAGTYRLSYPGTSDEGFYTITVQSATGNAYTIRATATGAQTSDAGCTQLEIAYPAKTKTPAACWN